MYLAFNSWTLALTGFTVGMAAADDAELWKRNQCWHNISSKIQKMLDPVD
jgi:uncharacterized protein YaeQ